MTDMAALWKRCASKLYTDCMMLEYMARMYMRRNAELEKEIAELKAKYENH